MKGETTYRILKFIEDGITTLIDLQLAIAKSGGYASGRKIDFNFEKIHQKRNFFTDWLFLTEEGKKESRRFKQFLSKLRRQGLVSFDEDRRLFLTADGQSRAQILSVRKKHRDFNKQSDKTFKIIVFDIPVGKDEKRYWLRSALKNIGFKMLQKSVWIGKVKIPENFLESLEDFDLLDNVEILEVTKSGSVKEFKST